MKRGTQIAYLPSHVRGDIKHEDVQFGFAVKRGNNPNFWFCRYWHQGLPGTMRTTANSELTNILNIQLHDSVSQEVVDQWLERLKEE